VITPWAFGHFLLRSQGVFALPVGKDSTQRSVQFSGAGSMNLSNAYDIILVVAGIVLTGLSAWDLIKNWVKFGWPKRIRDASVSSAG